MLLLRAVRENRWYKADAARWLEQGDIPADPLGDCKTSGNRLSVYQVDNDRSNVERIVRAIALGANELADTGYVLFDSGLLDAAGIPTDPKAGTTPDKGVNAWHLDLVELSGNRLVALVKRILETGETGTVLKKRVRELVEEGIRTGQLSSKFQSRLTS
jgi:hypothetical protein